MIKNFLIAGSLVLVATQAQAVTLTIDEKTPHLMVGSVFMSNTSSKEASIKVPGITTNYNQWHPNRLSCDQAVVEVENQLIVISPTDKRDLYGTFDRVINLSCVPVTVTVTTP